MLSQGDKRSFACHLGVDLDVGRHSMLFGAKQPNCLPYSAILHVSVFFDFLNFSKFQMAMPYVPCSLSKRTQWNQKGLPYSCNQE